MKKRKTSRRGGKRPGAGRKRMYDPDVKYSVKITIEQAALLKKWGGGDISDGLRWLVDIARLFITPYST